MLQCESIECDWKYSFNILKKQGRFYEVNLRTVLAFRETGKAHNAMTTFNKVMNMPHPQTRRVFTKIQNITQNILDHTLALTVQLQEEKNDIAKSMKQINLWKDQLARPRSSVDEYHDLCYDKAL